MAQLQISTLRSDFHSDATVFTSARRISSLKFSELGDRTMDDVKAFSSIPDLDICELDSSKPDSESLLPWLRPTWKTNKQFHCWIVVTVYSTTTDLPNMPVISHYNPENKQLHCWIVVKVYHAISKLPNMPAISHYNPEKQTNKYIAES